MSFAFYTDDRIIGADSTLQGADANNLAGSVTKENDLSRYE